MHNEYANQHVLVRDKCYFELTEVINKKKTIMFRMSRHTLSQETQLYIGLAVLLTSKFVSTFKTAIILYRLNTLAFIISIITSIIALHIGHAALLASMLFSTFKNCHYIICMQIKYFVFYYSMKALHRFISASLYHQRQCLSQPS